MSGFVDERIAVDVSDLRSGQEDFSTHLHSWWLIHQCQKGGPGQLVMGQHEAAAPWGLGAKGLPLGWLGRAWQPGPVPPPWPGAGQQGHWGQTQPRAWGTSLGMG